MHTITNGNMYKFNHREGIKEDEKSIQEDIRDLFYNVNIFGYQLKYRNISFNISNRGETDGVGYFYDQNGVNPVVFLNETKILIDHTKFNGCFSNPFVSHIIQALNYYNSLILTGHDNVKFLTLTSKDEIAFIDLTDVYNKNVLYV